MSERFDPLAFQCPYCGRSVRVVDEHTLARNFVPMDRDRFPRVGQHSAIVHKVPPCKEFARMDPARYLEEVRRIWAQVAPS